MEKIKLKSGEIVNAKSIEHSNGVLSFDISHKDYNGLRDCFNTDALSIIQIYNSKKLTAIYEGYTSLLPVYVSADAVRISLKKEQQEDRGSILSGMYKIGIIDDIRLDACVAKGLITPEERLQIAK